MRKTFESVLNLFIELRGLQTELESEMQECLRTFYELSRACPLSARGRKRPTGRIRQIYLVSRSRKAFKVVGHRKVRLCHHLRGRINAGLIREVAYDLKRAPQWYQADATRLKLNRRSACYAKALRILRLSLTNKFSSKATVADRAALQLLLEAHPNLAHDAPGLLGAVVFDRLLRELESAISQKVLMWKERMSALPFEPMIRWRQSGPLRLSWAYVDRYYDAQGAIQLRSHDVPGGISDAWLRKNYPDGGASRRKEILSYVTALRGHTRHYSSLLVYVGRLKARIRSSFIQAVTGARPVAGAEAV